MFSLPNTFLSVMAIFAPFFQGPFGNTPKSSSPVPSWPLATEP
jgi:hypothetical protein